ncbi:hypothetical protein ACN4DP_05070 [Corynebacterium macclintockiae]|uniref:hypothetical protein n=1 Tax=Corynebacterium macclintockiae TaxID=2913501 RepID=UPI003EBA0BB0
MLVLARLLIASQLVGSVPEGLLEVYWTPDTQYRILSRLEVRENKQDENLLRQRRGVAPVVKVPKRQKVRQRP